MERNRKMESPDITIVVPAYNEGGAITKTLEGLREVVRRLQRHVEIIVVDDGSQDNTGESVRAFPEIKLLRHTINRGYGASLKTGVHAAHAETVVITDADGTYPLDEIPRLLERFEAEKLDMVVGVRTGARVTYSALRRIPKIFLRRYVNWITQSEVPDFNSGLRVFRRSLAVKYTPLLPDGFSFTTTITIAALCNHYHVRYEPIDYFRRTGKSHIKPIQDTLRFFRLVATIGMFFAPLRILGPVIAVSLAAFLASIIYDVFWEQNLQDKTVVLLTFTFNLALFGTLADMIRRYREIK
ncbi:MAG: glycosyltransferase family 2 protein [Opitutales bacterium]